MAFNISLAVCVLIKIPVLLEITVSNAPPAFIAITGHPAACASTGTIPKSSIPGNIKALADAYKIRSFSREILS